MLTSLLSFVLLQQPIQVRLVIDEPEAALRILDKRNAGMELVNSDWEELFDTEGYKRLRERELGMKRQFTEEDFKKFMLSEELLKQREALRTTLDRCKTIDIANCARTSLAYLPEGSELKGTVMYLIKPRPNSFVWGTETNDPAVMLYLNVNQSAEDLAMTIAHEFHHIGFSSRCPSPEYRAWYDKQTKSKQTAMTWMRAFGEGYAVLASMGGPDTQPYKHSSKEVRDAFGEGVLKNAERMKALQSFFEDVLSGKFSEEKSQEKAMEFYGIVGPWYTTGWVMACAIERVYGRQRLLDCYLDPRLTLATYNAAAKQLGNMPTWPEDLVKGLS